MIAVQKRKTKSKIKKFPTFYNNYNIFMEIKIFYKDIYKKQKNKTKS